MMRARLIAFLVYALMVFCVVYFGTVRETYPHQAASGWVYPLECCSNQDCYEIEASEVKPGPEGSYTILKSSEVFFPPNAAGGKNFKWSPDGRFHRCTYSKQNDSTQTICLFVPQPGV
jgi:hypothetical protein